MSKKTDVPDSDETARNKHALDPEEMTDIDLSDVDPQTSNKTEKHSSVEKLAASRPEFGESPGAKPVDGAFGKDDDEEKIGNRSMSKEAS